jgi:hypothetical protein
LGSEIRKKLIPDPGFKKSTGSRIRIRNTDFAPTVRFARHDFCLSCSFRFEDKEHLHVQRCVSAAFVVLVVQAFFGLALKTIES